MRSVRCPFLLAAGVTLAAFAVGRGQARAVFAASHRGIGARRVGLEIELSTSPATEALPGDGLNSGLFTVPEPGSDEVDWETGAIIGTGIGGIDTVGDWVVPKVNDQAPVNGSGNGAGR